MVARCSWIPAHVSRCLVQQLDLGNQQRSIGATTKLRAGLTGLPESAHRARGSLRPGFARQHQRQHRQQSPSSCHAQRGPHALPHLTQGQRADDKLSSCEVQHPTLISQQVAMITHQLAHTACCLSTVCAPRSKSTCFCPALHLQAKFAAKCMVHTMPQN